MDRSQRSLQDYLAAARNEAGISEVEVRAIVEAGRSAGAGTAAGSGWLRRSMLAWGAVLVLTTGGVTALLLQSDAPVAETVSVGTTAKRYAPPLVPPPAASVQSNDREGVDTAVAVRSTQSRQVTKSIERADRRRLADATDISEQTTISEQGEIMNFNRIRQFAGSAVVAASVIAASHTATAQAPQSIEETKSPVMERFEREIGSAVYDYWIVRLNDYKRTIDRTLSPSDLATLNSLRVRFGMMISDATAETRVDSKTAPEGKNSVSLSFGLSDEQGIEKVQEFFTIFQETKDIAGRYRPEFKPLGKGVVNDFFGFVDLMATSADRFIVENRAEIEREKGGAELLKSDIQAEMREGMSELRSDEGRMMIELGYAQFIEPMIMLFDGAELSLFLQQAAPFAKGVTGLNLPDASLLQQSTPNPAGSSVAIGYLLAEPSDRTVLRLFNSSGSLVGTFNQGSRPAGQNSAMIDVSTYPVGKYLYHLTIQTSQGEQVYSKSMQVVR